MNAPAGSLRRLYTIAGVVLGLTLAYAVVRYHVLKGVPYSQLPLFTLNKAVSWTALCLLGLSSAMTPLTRLGFSKIDEKLPSRQHLGMLCCLLAGIHIVVSLILISPQRFPKLFLDGNLNVTGSLSLVFGVIAAAALVVCAVSSRPAESDAAQNGRRPMVRRAGLVALLAILMHVTVMGSRGWLTLSSWPGNLPPITLLSALCALTPLVLRLLASASGKRQCPPRP